MPQVHGRINVFNTEAEGLRQLGKSLNVTRIVRKLGKFTFE